MAVIRDLWNWLTVCRREGHLWRRAFYGDAIRQMNATHLCERCGKRGDPPKTRDALRGHPGEGAPALQRQTTSQAPRSYDRGVTPWRHPLCPS